MPYRTFPRNNRHIPRGVNCAFGNEAEAEEDNEDYFDEDWSNPDYHGVRPKYPVNFTENDNNYSPIELEFGDIDGRHTDSEAGGY